jgi:hypothetical protein
MLTAVEVVAADETTLLRLDGDALVQATQPLGDLTPTREIPASGTVAVVMDVVVPRDRAVARVDHRITYEVAPDAPGRTLLTGFAVDGPDLAVDPRPATVLVPPLRGDGWLAFNGCCQPISGHRAARVVAGGASIAKIETFAVDFIRLRDGKFFDGDGARNDQWFAYGAEVLAVATGTVVSVRDGMPEETPNQPIQHVKQLSDFGGNAVTIEIAPGVFAFYAHFQPGSITVNVGDTVQTGQVLGKLGNSGKSTAPHLHLHLIDAPDPVTANSLPMVFDRYTLVGTVAPDAVLAAVTAPTASAAPTLAPEGTPRDQTATLPLNLVVVDFR